MVVQGVPATTLRLYLTALAFERRELPRAKIADALVIAGLAGVCDDGYAITTKGVETLDRILAARGERRADVIAAWAAKQEALS